MGLYNFQERFVPFIQDGTKTGTIRTIRKYPQHEGRLMHLFTGLRTKHAMRIIKAPFCKKVKTIFILTDGNVYVKDEAMSEIEAKEFCSFMERTKHFTPSSFLDEYEKDELAFHDGFRHSDNLNKIDGCFEIMLRWWNQTHSLPFYGHLNLWK